jgi:hypothetical protein
MDGLSGAIWRCRLVFRKLTGAAYWLLSGCCVEWVQPRSGFAAGAGMHVQLSAAKLFLFELASKQGGVALSLFAQFLTIQVGHSALTSTSYIIIHHQRRSVSPNRTTAGREARAARQEMWP